jgi:predicted house-cleaning noncanonical NTP pyrophosphatase (MazG superfamily)
LNKGERDMERVEIISNFLNELNDKIQNEVKEFFELDYDEKLQRTYSAIDHIIEHINDILEKVVDEDKEEVLELFIRQNNISLAIEFSHILPIQETIALYFANGHILLQVMQYYVEALNYMLEKLKEGRK